LFMMSIYAPHLVARVVQGCWPVSKNAICAFTIACVSALSTDGCHRRTPVRQRPKNGFANLRVACTPLTALPPPSSLLPQQLLSHLQLRREDLLMSWGAAAHNSSRAARCASTRRKCRRVEPFVHGCFAAAKNGDASYNPTRMLQNGVEYRSVALHTPEDMAFK
jgi:hypothetical protein